MFVKHLHLWALNRAGEQLLLAICFSRDCVRARSITRSKIFFRFSREFSFIKLMGSARVNTSFFCLRGLRRRLIRPHNVFHQRFLSRSRAICEISSLNDRGRVILSRTPNHMYLLSLTWSHTLSLSMKRLFILLQPLFSLIAPDIRRAKYEWSFRLLRQLSSELFDDSLGARNVSCAVHMYTHARRRRRRRPTHSSSIMLFSCKHRSFADKKEFEATSSWFTHTHTYMKIHSMQTWLFFSSFNRSTAEKSKHDKSSSAFRSHIIGSCVISSPPPEIIKARQIVVRRRGQRRRISSW